MIAFAVVALLAIAPMSMAYEIPIKEYTGPLGDGPSREAGVCQSFADIPVYSADDMGLIESGDYKLSFLGRINYTDSEWGREMYMPLHARSFTVEPNKRGTGPDTLVVEFDCGVMEIDEYLKEGTPKNEAMYSIYGFYPRIDLDGNEIFWSIDSNPTSAKFGLPVFEGTVLENERYWCWAEGESRAVASLYVQYMRVDNGASN